MMIMGKNKFIYCAIAIFIVFVILLNTAVANINHDCNITKKPFSATQPTLVKLLNKLTIVNMGF